MSITLYEELAFRFFALFYFYWYPMPVKWDLKNAKLKLNLKPRIKLIPIIFILLAMWTHGWATIFLTVYLGTTRTSKEFPRINTAVHVGCGSVLIICVTIMFILSQNFGTIISTINSGLDITDSIRKEYSSRSKNKIFRFGTSLPLLLIVTWTFTGLFIPLCVLYTDLDATYYMFEILFPTPLYRLGTTIWFILLARFVINFVMVLETVRCGTFVLCTMLIILDRTTKAGKILLKRCRNADRFCAYYKIGLILFRRCEHELTTCVYLGMSIIFWGTIICFWVCVKCKIADVTLLLDLIFGVGCLTSAFAHVLVLPVLCKGLSMAEHIVKFQQLIAELRLAKIKSRGRRIALKKVKSILPIRLKYGSFWYISEDFAAEYFWLFNLRAFDAILLVDY